MAKNATLKRLVDVDPESERLVRYAITDGAVMLLGKGTPRDVVRDKNGALVIIHPPKAVTFPTIDKYVSADGMVAVIGKVERTPKVTPSKSQPPSAEATVSTPAASKGRNYPTCDACGKRMPVNPAHVHKCKVPAGNVAEVIVSAPADGVISGLQYLSKTDLLRVAREALKHLSMNA